MPDLDHFLKDVRGVIHVGANLGQEREIYQGYELNVLWIEPIQEVFTQLVENVCEIPGQRAVQALVTDRNDEEYEFNLASNSGASSSIFRPKEVSEYWPGVRFDQRRTMTSTTLPAVLRREQIDVDAYDTLVLDTQGSELLVLAGCIPLLSHFRYVKTEVANYDAYAGCCKLEDIEEFMGKHGFVEHVRVKYARQRGGRAYFDIIFRAATPKTIG